MLRCVSVSGGTGSEIGGSGAVSIIAAAVVPVPFGPVATSGTLASDPFFPVLCTSIPAAIDEADVGKGVDSLAMVRFLPLILVGTRRENARRCQESDYTRDRTKGRKDRLRGMKLTDTM